MSGNQQSTSESESAVLSGTKLYLLTYNSLQVIGWSYVLMQTIKSLVSGSPDELWESVNPSLIIFQTAAFLEIINVMMGFVRSALMTTIFQVFSRLFILWLYLYTAPPSRNCTGFILLLFAWSITEIIRYSFYATGIISKIPFIITWARYTFFYILYPIGVTGELWVVYQSLAYIKEFKPYTYELPNVLNFSYSFEYFTYFVAFLYLPLFPVLYMHMIALRKKVLGKKPAS